MKRKKRLEKGIGSIDEEIKLHEEKREKAKEEGKLELTGYYDKEILGLEKTRDRKKKQFEKTNVRF